MPKKTTNQMVNIGEHNSVKLMEAPSFLVQYTDGNGNTEVRLAFILGGEVRFLENNALSKPAQQWLKNDVLVAAGLKDPEKEETTPGRLEEQI